MKVLLGANFSRTLVNGQYKRGCQRCGRLRVGGGELRSLSSENRYRTTMMSTSALSSTMAAEICRDA
jgi:hypothetical protein